MGETAGNRKRKDEAVRYNMFSAVVAPG